MATAAAHLEATRQVSPELALIDAALADELRALLAPSDPDTAPAHPVPPAAELVPDAVVVVETVALTLESSSHVDASDLIVGAEPDAPPEPERTSGYPALPAPEDAVKDPMEAAEAALREIRARLGADVPDGGRRRFRSRFTVALGASVLLGAAMLAVDAYYGIAPFAV